MKRPVSELISEAENRLRDTRSRIAEQQRIIARRTAIGADVTQSMTLLENLEAIALLRERRLRYLREWRP
jgi:hypothetical protein